MSKASLLKTAAFLIPLAGLLYFGITEDPYRPIERGEPAPDFSLPTLAGGSLELAQFQGKLVVLNFWATWCPPCVEEMPSLERLSRQGAERNLEVVTVSVDQDLSVLQDFIAQHDLTLPVASDPQRQVAVLYGTYKYPESYIISPQGIVHDKMIGAIDWDEARIREHLFSLANGAQAAQF